MEYIVNGKDKGTIFCIHGNSSSSKVFENLLNSDKISQTKIAVDLFGHGENNLDSLDLDSLSFESQKKFLLQKISEIDDDILLVGNSMGGHLAIEIANETTNIKGLVIMGAPPLKSPINFEEAFVSVPALNTFLTEFPEDREIIEAFDVILFNKSEKSKMVTEFKKSNPLVRKAIAIDLMENKLLNQYSIFQQLPFPKYIVRGDSDLSIDSHYLDTIRNTCDDSCEIVDVENCGHYPSMDRPSEFIDIIRNIATELFRK